MTRWGETWDASPLADRWAQRGFSDSPRDAMWDLSADAPPAGGRASISRSEFEDDAFAYSLAWRYISDEPGMFAYACCVRVGRLWQLFPYPRSVPESARDKMLRVLTGGWYTVLLLLAIAGDKVDNIPGVPKVGAKTAAKWLNEYDSADGIVEHAEDIKGKVGESLRDNIEQLRLSQRLAAIRPGVAFLGKPFRAEALVQEVERATSDRASTRAS